MSEKLTDFLSTHCDKLILIYDVSIFLHTLCDTFTRCRYAVCTLVMRVKVTEYLFNNIETLLCNANDAPFVHVLHQEHYLQNMVHQYFKILLAVTS